MKFTVDQQEEILSTLNSLTEKINAKGTIITVRDGEIFLKLADMALYCDDGIEVQRKELKPPQRRATISTPSTSNSKSMTPLLTARRTASQLANNIPLQDFSFDNNSHLSWLFTLDEKTTLQTWFKANFNTSEARTSFHARCKHIEFIMLNHFYFFIDRDRSRNNKFNIFDETFPMCSRPNNNILYAAKYFSQNEYEWLNKNTDIVFSAWFDCLGLDAREDFIKRLTEFNKKMRELNDKIIATTRSKSPSPEEAAPSATNTQRKRSCTIS